jgi:DNA modification methylase
MKTKDLNPADYNPRKITDEQLHRLKKSMTEFGDLSGIIFNIRTNNLIGGHQRIKHFDDSWKIVKKKSTDDLGTVAVGYVDTPFGRWFYREVDWDETKEKAANIAANKHGGEFDRDLLGGILGELVQIDLDMELTGFDEAEIFKLISKPDGLTDPDDIPEPPDDPVTKPGDIYLCGNHRLMCGDSTSSEDVSRLLGNVKPLLMVTDPPYGVEYDPTWRADRGISKRTNKMGTVSNDDKFDWRDAWALFPGSIAYIWHGDRHAGQVLDSVEAAGFEIRCQIIWAKDRFALSRGDYHWQHEPCWYAVKKGAISNWTGDRSQTTLWNIKAREDSGHGHGTQKPVECMQRPIENNSSPGQVVYDPFIGSGSTMIAAEITGRCCYGMEIDPVYCDIIIQRWENFTGLKAEKETSNGKARAETKTGKAKKT